MSSLVPQQTALMTRDRGSLSFHERQRFKLSTFVYLQLIHPEHDDFADDVCFDKNSQFHLCYHHRRNHMSQNSNPSYCKPTAPCTGKPPYNGECFQM